MKDNCEKMELNNKYILDACCSVKGMWYNKNHPNAIYIDIRDENKGFIKGRNEEVKPDYIMDFRDMSFPDKSFKLVVLEPPHLKTLGKTSKFRKFFGCLNAETWQSDIKQAFNECWRVLDDYGTLVFKWSDNEIPFKQVLALAPEKPLFYNITNNKAKSVTKWFCFMKIPKANGQGVLSSDEESLIGIKRGFFGNPQIPNETSLNSDIKCNNWRCLK